MRNINPERTNMLADLIEASASGKKVVLMGSTTREIVRLRREGQNVDNVILSMEYRGTIDGKPFAFKKNYSLAEDGAQYALECLLTANNRLQMDYDRLKEAGIEAKDEFFTFQNSFIGIPGDASIKRPALRLQDFVHLSHTGTPVFVDVNLKRPEITLKQEGMDKKGTAYAADFVFAVGEEKTIIEKLYALGSFDESKKYKEEIKYMANKRFKRDCQRLRHAGMQVDRLSF